MYFVGILNKITPQTFEKLSAQLMEIKLLDVPMMDKVVDIIFEKAIFEPNFTAMYADLCFQLKECGSCVSYIVVKQNEDYFWICDFTFPEEASGPFYARNEIMELINNSSESELPEMKPINTTLDVDSIEYYLQKNVLWKVINKYINLLPMPL